MPLENTAGLPKYMCIVTLILVTPMWWRQRPGCCAHEWERILGAAKDLSELFLSKMSLGHRDSSTGDFYLLYEFDQVGVLYIFHHVRVF